MFITKKVIVSILAVVSAILIVYYIFQSRKNRKWFDSHPYIHEINKEGTYTVKRITDRILNYHYNDMFATGEERQEYYRESNPKERFGGHVFYDTLHQTFWVETSWYSNLEEGGSPDPDTEWINLDREGKVIDKKKEIDSVTAKGLLMLKNEITNFYNWKDSETLFHVQHFAREKFNWNSLNPLQGYGSPTGGPRKTYWEGVAYLKLQLEKSVIQFKTKTRTTYSGYEFWIDLYRFPKSYNSGKELTFLYIDDAFLNHADKGLYLIKTSDR
jgi:hypothetical protein